MTEMAALGLKPSETKNDLAETYLSKHENFTNWPAPEMLCVVYNYPDNITQRKCEDYDCLMKNTYSHPDKPIYAGIQLAKLLEQNVELFCQLENTLRGTAVEDVKNSIVLMSQHLQCSNTLWASEYLNNIVSIRMDENTPLLNLGCVAAALFIKDVRAEVVVTSKNVAPLCYLFVKLCSEVGWVMPLVIVHNSEAYNLAYSSVIKQVPVIEQNCTAVVTEQADIDSALDSIIYSSVTAPWRLRQVFVQESVYEEFKSGLAWKGERVNTDSCADAFKARGKTFLCDRIKLQNKNNEPEVSVEAYRTVKELFGLMKQKSTLFLSIWAESSGLSFEIAQGSPCNFIWINEYAAFKGPIQSCLPVYEQLYTGSLMKVSTDILNLPTHKTWIQYKVEDRRNIIVKALHYLKSNESIAKFLGLFACEGLDNSESNDDSEIYESVTSGSNFVHVDDGTFCFGFARPAVNEDVAYIKCVNNQKDLLKILNYCLNGYKVVYGLNGRQFNNIIPEALKSLEADGVPIKLESKVADETEEIVVPIFNRFKVIHTRFGTVFAN